MAAISLILANALSVSAATETLQYGYDDKLQLLKTTYDDGTGIDYVYDNMGNRLLKTTTLVSVAEKKGHKKA